MGYAIVSPIITMNYGCHAREGKADKIYSPTGAMSSSVRGSPRFPWNPRFKTFPEGTGVIKGPGFVLDKADV
jgi:hypothetical protein